MPPLVSVPAGRAIRRSPTTKWVDPLPDKGVIELNIEDDLMHLYWRNRETGLSEDDLIIFPGEATFEKVNQDPSGRSCILKFSSSDQKYFFWFQNRSTEGDLRAEVDINALLQDPSYTPGWAPLPDRPSSTAAQASSSTGQTHTPTPGAPKLSHPEPGPPLDDSSSAAAGGTGASQEEMARALVEWAHTGGLGGLQQEDARLTDVLSPANITNLISTHPTLISTLTPLLPPGLSLPSEPTAADLTPILTAPQFTDAIASLDNALRSGGLPGGMMRELGLPEEAGQGVKQFLEALKGLEKKQDDDRMEED